MQRTVVTVSHFARGIRTFSEAASSAPRALDVTLFQYEVCPFCCLTKAFLDVNDIPYRTIEVNPITKRKLLLAFGKSRYAD